MAIPVDDRDIWKSAEYDTVDFNLNSAMEKA